ncbi:MAG TPA: protein translocase subunit SecD [Vicinamibacterales bacterium]|jgi:preprotein translocase subunit SecD|nr:protein translocase subunit SecD [Vicinamibacterales bacterium]
MTQNVMWKLGLIVAVIALSVGSFYFKGMNLGLDLKGGVHLVLKVRTDDGLRAETETVVERLRDTLTRGSIQFSKLEMKDAKTFVVEGIQNDQAYRAAATDPDTVFNRSSGVGSYTYAMKPNIENQVRDETVNQALLTIERRVNELGVAEPIVARQGAVDQILVELPGVSDVQRAKDIIRSTAQLELKIVEQGPFGTEEAAKQAYNNNVPADVLLLPGASEAGAVAGTPGTVFYAVRRASVVTGRDLRNARPSLDENNLPAVGFSLNSDGARKFGAATEANIGKQLAIVLDGRVHSAPVIQSRISDEGRISGSFTQQEAQDLSLTLRSGALPATLDSLEERTVGPSLGADSVRAGVVASIGGLAFVVLFMIFYYKLTGLNAVISIVVNLLILLGLMAYLGSTMTLPGIAGFILTIGMGVDSNVLIFERIKEELSGTRGARAAVNAGFDRVWWTIVDTHVSSLISALLLLQFGTGPIRGFAVTLIIGLASNVFTAVFVSRTVFELVLGQRKTQALSI